jgi:hypothetical protein
MWLKIHCAWGGRLHAFFLLRMVGMKLETGHKAAASSPHFSLGQSEFIFL